MRTRRPSVATVLAFTALMVALSGTAVGQTAVTAAKKLITGNQIKDNSITTKDVKNGSLLAKDFKAGQLPAGERGPAGANGLNGAPGPQGPTGATGTVDTSAFYDKAQSDARFLQGQGKALLDHGNVNVAGVDSPSKAETALATVPGFGTFRLVGSNAAPGNDCKIGFQNTSGGPLALNGGTSVADGATAELMGMDARPGGFTSQFGIVDTGAAHSVTGSLVITYGFPSAANFLCAAAVHAFVSP